MHDYSTICCAKPNPVPPRFCCMWSEIVQDYNVLCKRYSKATLKRQHSRLRVLAEPKHHERKYQEKCMCPNAERCKVKLIDNTDQMANTRIEQLALPKPRYISGLKQQQTFENFTDDRKSDVNRLLRKSLLSVYSRLMNVKHDATESKSKTLDPHVKNKLMKNLEKLSTPKKDFSLVKTKKFGGKNKTPTMKRIRKLSKPKKYSKCEPNKWILTDALKHFKPTERLLNMSKPKPKNNYFEFLEPFRIQPNVLTYNATPRIKMLAQPLQYNSKREEKIENTIQTNPTTFKALASKRIMELASPRSFYDTHSRTYPFKVSSKALKAKISARILKLAEPKKRKP